MAGQVDLAVLADDPAGLVDEDRRVEAARAPVLDGELGVAEIKADAELARPVEQRLRLGFGHLALEIGVDLGLVLDPPVREERRQRAFGKDDEIAAVRLGLAHQRDHAGDRLVRLSSRDRAELGGADGDDAAMTSGSSDRFCLSRDAEKWRSRPRLLHRC